MPAECRCTLPTPVGNLLLGAQRGALTELVILAGDQASCGAEWPSNPAAIGDHPVLQQAVAQLEEYFAGARREFQLPLDLGGLPPFTQKILAVLQSVPFGETPTYGELAARAGFPRAARAVGAAMAANPLPIIIPCHRVVAAGGRPGGYSGGGGLATKGWLLAFERNVCRGNQADFQEKQLDRGRCHLLHRGPHFG